MIIGDKLTFAIDFEISEPNFGDFRIWIQSQALGTKENTFLLPNLNALSRLKDYSLFEDLNFYTFSAKSIFRSILNNEQLYNQTLLGFGESFDHFEIRAYLFWSKVVFIWEVVNDINSGLNSYRKGETYMGLVDYNLYFSTIKNVKAIVNT